MDFGLCMYHYLLLLLLLLLLSIHTRSNWWLSLDISRVFTEPLHHEQDATQGQIFKRSKLVRVQSFPFPRLVALPSLKNPVWLSGKRVGYMPFSRELACSETQIALSKIWTGVADSISYDDNHDAEHIYWISNDSKSSKHPLIVILPGFSNTVVRMAWIFPQISSSFTFSYLRLFQTHQLWS